MQNTKNAKKEKLTWQEFRNSSSYFDKKSKALNGTKNALLAIFRFIVIVGISYVILAPVIGIISNSFFSRQDSINPMVFTIPINPTLERYTMAIKYMDYLPILGRTVVYVVGITLIQLLICSMVGYGFARFNFPFKGLLFGCVLVMIVVPLNTIQFPLYITFRYFNILPFTIAAAALGLAIAVMGLLDKGKGVRKALMLIAGLAVLGAGIYFTWQNLAAGHPTPNLLQTPWPTVIMSVFGCGLRSGLYIYIFNQFFRGLPKEIEEAALVDGASPGYTYFRIMLPNASPAVITVAVFSIVWQYNDSFFANTFNIPDSILITRKLDSLINVIANAEKVLTIREQQLYFDAGVVLVLVPVVLIYLILQRRFIEGVERSGIVG